MRTLLVGAVVGLLAIAGWSVAGCSGAGDDGERTSGEPSVSRDSRAGTGAADTAGTPGGAPEARPPSFADLPDGATPLDGRDVIRTATIAVRVKRVGAAADDAIGVVTAAGGVLASEQAAFGTRSEAVMVFEVPPARFRPVLDRLGGLGEPVDQQVSTEDVTGQVVDLESRLASATASASRLRALFGQATNVGEVVAIEAELVRREAEVETLEGQLRVLRSQVELATITLTLTRLAAVPAGPEDATTGFVAGLERGWDALVELADAGATAAGAVLPFAVVLGAGALVVLALRRRRRGRSPQAGAGAAV
jgi:hypothetical protein